MTLVKAEIRPIKNGAAPIPVLFNPTQYSLEKANVVNETPVARSGSPIVSYTRGTARTLSMELFCDTYGTGDSVTKFTDAIYGLLEVDGDRHEPVQCDFVWGRSFTFRCYVERVSGRFTLFRPDGTPVRASLTVTFKEYVAREIAAKSPALMSADHTKTRATQRGDTLASIAAEEYGDPRLWRAIAEANGIENPRRLEAARTLVIPPLPGTGTAT